jgi:hypothetical protein
MSRERNINYETAVIQSNELEIRVSVELREKDTITSKFERTGNWWSCITDLKHGHILGGSTSGTGNFSDTPLELAWKLLEENLRERFRKLI